MKLIVFILLFPYSLFAQNSIKVKVVSENESLPYACIYINSKPLYATDSAGIATIPEQELKQGDTISVSFLGFESNAAVYNESDILYEINLPAIFQLNEITIISGFDQYKFFKKHVKIPKLNYSFKQYDINFEYFCEKSSPKGNISIVLSPRIDLDYRFKCLLLKMDGDTTNIKNRIGYSILDAIFSAHSLAFTNYKSMYISYKGIIDGERIFILSNENAKYKYQYLLYVNKDTKNINRMEVLRWNDNFHEFNNLSLTHSKKEIKISDYLYEYKSGDKYYQIKAIEIKESPYKNAWDLFRNKNGEKILF